MVIHLRRRSFCSPLQTTTHTMSRTSKQLEDEITAMENRLAAAKVTVEVEQEAWTKVAHKGKLGTKWKGAAPAKRPTPLVGGTSRSEVENEHGEMVLEPMCWDALELAQHFQGKQLSVFAKVVVSEQITGKLLLETAPSKLRALFKDQVPGGAKNDPSWKAFLKNCSELHQLQEKVDGNNAETNVCTAETNANTDKSSKPTKATLFPVISPRMPALTASALGSKTKSPMISAHIGGADAPERLKTPGRLHASSMFRKTKTSSSSQPLATCWNCGARFPRSNGVSKSQSTVIESMLAPTLRLFCSKACQAAIESSDMRVSASVSLAPSQPLVTDHPSQPPPKPPGSLATVVKSPRHRGPNPAPTEAFDFLHVAHRGPAAPPSTTHRQPSTRKRLACAPPPSSSVSGGGELSPVASITCVRALPETAMPSLLGHTVESSQSRVFQQSKYKLDPELFHANGVSWITCFDATVPASPVPGQRSAHTLTNLDTLVQFLSVKAVHHLSVTCHKWFVLIHLHPLSGERVWNVLLRRMWLFSATLDDVRHLQDIVGKNMNKKTRRAMMKLTRQLQKTVLDCMKILLQTDNWQLAEVCHNDVDYLPLSVSRSGIVHDVGDPSVDRGNDLYEFITVICNQNGEIVAVQARELMRPIDENGSTLAILQGIKTGTLSTVLCRRLRAFALTNRLPFSEWYLLPDVFVVLEFCDMFPGNGSPPLSVWQSRVLERLQTQLTKRLLGKESVQQVMRRMTEQAAPQEAIDAFEHFLARLAPGLFGSSRRNNS